MDATARFSGYANFINVFAIDGCDNMPDNMPENEIKREKKWLVSVKSPVRIWILPIIGLLYFIWFIAIFLIPQFTTAPKDWPYIAVEPYADDGSWLWLSWAGIGVVLYAVLFFIELILIIGWRKQIRKEQATFEVVEEFEVSPVPAYGEGEKEQKWIEAEKMDGKTVAGFAYPANLAGGVYGNSFIGIDDGSVLKMRSLMAKPCAVCEERATCWDSYKDKMRYNYFLSNVDCKAGLDLIARGDVAPMKRPDAGAWKPDQPKPEMISEEQKPGIHEPGGGAGASQIPEDVCRHRTH